jgi:maleylacetoacetate isomerase
VKFYGYYRSSAAYRCRIALNLKGVDTEFVPVHLRRDGGQQRKPEYRALNPQALVPSLEVDGRVLTQSLAIIEWLEETRPEPPLLPRDAFERAEVRAFAQAIAIDVHPLNNLRVLLYLKNTLKQEQSAIDQWYCHWVALGFAACEELVARGGRRGPFCFGDRPTLADICLVPQMYNARRLNCDLSPYPRLVEIDAYCNRQAGFADAHPDKQPDSEP